MIYKKLQMNTIHAAVFANDKTVVEVLSVEQGGVAEQLIQSLQVQ